MKYRITIGACGRFVEGDVVEGHELGNIEYLERIGAIEPVDDDTPLYVWADRKSVDAGQHAAEIAKRDAEIAALTARVTELEAQIADAKKPANDKKDAATQAG